MASPFNMQAFGEDSVLSLVNIMMEEAFWYPNPSARMKNTPNCIQMFARPNPLAVPPCITSINLCSDNFIITPISKHGRRYFTLHRWIVAFSWSSWWPFALWCTKRAPPIMILVMSSKILRRAWRSIRNSWPLFLFYYCNYLKQYKYECDPLFPYFNINSRLLKKECPSQTSIAIHSPYMPRYKRNIIILVSHSKETMQFL